MSTRQWKQQHKEIKKPRKTKEVRQSQVNPANQEPLLKNGQNKTPHYENSSKHQTQKEYQQNSPKE